MKNNTIAHVTVRDRFCHAISVPNNLFSERPDIPRPWEKEEGDEDEGRKNAD